MIFTKKVKKMPSKKRVARFFESGSILMYPFEIGFKRYSFLSIIKQDLIKNRTFLFW